MMNCIDVIRHRHSVRDYLPDPIPDEILSEILDAGRIAPSTQNRQPWRFVVIRDAQLKKNLAYKSGVIGLANTFLRQAPVIIIACADPQRDLILNQQAYYLVDTAIAFQQMVLAAWQHGIGSCWLAAFNEAKVKQVLQIPEHIRVIAMSPFGYPKDKTGLFAKAVEFIAQSHQRLTIDKIVSYDGYHFSEKEAK